eukprot:COSAG04_NODE_1492_length_6547_cov_6.137097_7_plen_46_part_00
MLNEADIYMGQLRATLKQREMWDNSLIVYSSGALSCSPASPLLSI